MNNVATFTPILGEGPPHPSTTAAISPPPHADTVPASQPAGKELLSGSVLIPEATAAIGADVPTCRIKIAAKGEEVVLNSRHGAFWGTEDVYALGQEGQFTGQVTPLRNYSVRDRFWADGSRWIVLGRLDLGDGMSIDPDSERPLLLKLDRKRGVVYLAGRGKVTLRDGKSIALGQKEDIRMCLALLNSKQEEEREAGAWIAGFLPVTDEQKVGLQDALVRALGAERDDCARIAALEAIGRIGNDKILGVLTDMSRKAQRSHSVSDGLYLSAKTILYEAIDWALDNVRARSKGASSSTSCRDCLMPKCVMSMGRPATRDGKEGQDRVKQAEP